MYQSQVFKQPLLRTLCGITKHLNGLSSLKSEKILPGFLDYQNLAFLPGIVQTTLVTFVNGEYFLFILKQVQIKYVNMAVILKSFQTLIRSQEQDKQLPSVFFLHRSSSRCLPPWLCPSLLMGQVETYCPFPWILWSACPKSKDLFTQLYYDDQIRKVSIGTMLSCNQLLV